VADSLVIANMIELMGGSGGVASQIPECAGATFRITEAYDLGTPQPTTDIVQSLILDGERPFGHRASNRTITLPLVIRAPDMGTLAAAREILLQIIDQQTWTMTWTPDGGLPLVFDCFRALPTVIQYGFLQRTQAISTMSISFQALPYGRSDIASLQQVAFASPITGGLAAPPAPVVLDHYTTVSGTHWSQSTTQYIAGPQTAMWTPPAVAWPYTPAAYTSSFTAQDITGRSTLSVWAGLAWDTPNFAYWPRWSGHTTFWWTLTDSGGHTLKFHVTRKCRFSNRAGVPVWTRVSAPIPASSTFNYAAVTSYSVTVTNWTGGGRSSLVYVSLFLDALTANPPSLATPASIRGTVYNITSPVGTARTPVTCQFQAATIGAPISQTLTGAGIWWPPPGVTSVLVECWGGGGAGSTRTTSGLGGGGGGGEYAAEATLPVATGTAVPYACGAAGTPGAAQVTQTFTNPGTAAWTVPDDVTSVKVECWGGGGAGGLAAGGGSGGAYATRTFTVSPGDSYNYQVAKGGTHSTGGNNGNSAWSSYFWDLDGSILVQGAGGYGCRDGGTAGGIVNPGSQGSTIHNGGAGGSAYGNGGGGGGASGGTTTGGTGGATSTTNTGGAGAAAPTGGGPGGNGASVGGAPGPGGAPGGGGGGGWASYGWGANGANGQVRLTYTPGGGAPVDGGDTTFGPATHAGTVVTANGGSSAPSNSATGGAGGSGSTNTTHYNGGAGWTTTALGGGGGAAAGAGGAGTAATSNAGASDTNGGGKGGTGASTTVAAQTGLQPGGGGGGGDYTGEPAGAPGGAGQVTVTWTPTLNPFKTLVAHRPGADSPDSLTPFVSMASSADIPDGREYPVPSLIAGVNAKFGGTYTVVAVNNYWDSPSTARTITVYVHQYEYLGGPVYTQSVAATLVPATADVTGNGFVVIGEITIPAKDIDPSNNSAYFTVGITDSDTSDQFLDILFLDTQGQTIVVNSTTAYLNMFVDEPDIDRDIGRVLGSQYDRSQGISILDQATLSGGPITIDPGENLLLAYAVEGAPNLAVSYLPRWYADRLV
jgi:hypothetical protein